MGKPLYAGSVDDQARTDESSLLPRLELIEQSDLGERADSYIRLHDELASALDSDSDQDAGE